MTIDEILQEVDLVVAERLHVELNTLVVAPCILILFGGGVHLVKVLVLRLAHHEPEKVQLLLAKGLDRLYEV